ncbi:MAG: sensor histidine kinase, partial [Nocardia sp.]|nr:sensor histidine kinase [Nocardia sp.]
ADAALAELNRKGDAAQKMNPGGSGARIAAFSNLFAQLPGARRGIDSGQLPPDQAFGLLTQFSSMIAGATMIAARVSPNSEVAVDLAHSVEPLRAGEALSKTVAIGELSTLGGGLTPAMWTRYNDYLGEFRGEMDYSQGLLTANRAQQLSAIRATPQWGSVNAMADAIAARGPNTDVDSAGRTRAGAAKAPLPMTMPQWQADAARIDDSLMRLWADQSRDAQNAARAHGDRTAIGSAFGGAGILLASLVGLIAALVMANRFVRRMKQLRSTTLELADVRLPDLMRRLEAGEKVSPGTAVELLDFGSDELGQVADAFNRAQVEAVSAAVAEANTRAGINTVFLDIAHRSQALVHRQLALLDQAERREENADQLELLFQLDHLSTRARRNAENLIILGGKQPGRRWRKPVPLLEVIRSAVAESRDYTRIRIERAPRSRVMGNAVADLIHVLAELMDNATSFSPPHTEVLVTASVVGRGVAIEIVDRGLGMKYEDLERRNQMLDDPPEFSVAALSNDNRLGLFVVAKLADRHGISVRLRESDFGGIQAVVLIGVPVLESDDIEDDPADSDFTGEFAAITAAPSVAGGYGAAHAAAAHNDVARTDAGQPAAETRLGASQYDDVEMSPERSSWFTSAWDRGEPEPPARTGSAGSDAGAYQANPVDEAPIEAELLEMEAADPTPPDMPPVDVVAVDTVPAAEKPEGTVRSGDTRPPLPRRVRKTAGGPAAATTGTNSVRHRSADQARNVISAVEKGTRRGRRAPAESGSPAFRFDRYEGDDGFTQPN